MTWIALSLLSAVFLGLYDIAKKSAVKDNAVPVVLLLNVVTAALFWSLPLFVAMAIPSNASQSLAMLVDLTAYQHILVMAKSALVGASWTSAFFALKHLPISIAAPIRATSPLWTVIVAVTFMGEQLSVSQWAGMSLVLLGFIAISRVGASEGIHFHRDQWIAWMVIATLLGSASALYDKYLFQTESLEPAAVQAWFSIYLVPVMLPLAIRWYYLDRHDKPFHWRWSIPMIALFLLISDFTYFQAVASDDALISVISGLRRSSVIVAFLFGIFRLAERNWKGKSLCILTILAGVYLLSRS